MDKTTFRIVFKWKKVPFGKEQVDYMGSMGDFRDFSEAVDAYAMLRDTLGPDWAVWINKNTENCELVFPLNIDKEI